MSIDGDVSSTTSSLLNDDLTVIYSINTIKYTRFNIGSRLGTDEPDVQFRFSTPPFSVGNYSVCAGEFCLKVGLNTFEIDLGFPLEL